MKNKKRTINIVIKWQPVLLFAVSLWSILLQRGNVDILSISIGMALGSGIMMIIADSIFERFTQDIHRMFDELEEIMKPSDKKKKNKTRN